MPLQTANPFNDHNTKMTIAQADIRQLEQISEWTYQLHQHEDEGDLMMHPRFKENLKKWISQELKNENSLFLIAQYGDNPAGFIFSNTQINDNGFIADPIKGVIHLLWVEKEFRGNKIAENLLHETEKCFSSIGVNYVEASYTSHNQLAMNFWQKNGYIQRSITARKML